MLEPGEEPPTGGYVAVDLEAARRFQQGLKGGAASVQALLFDDAHPLVIGKTSKVLGDYLRIHPAVCEFLKYSRPCC